MSIQEFRLDTKSAGAQALEGLWGPVVGDLLYDMSAKGRGRGNHATRTGTGPRSQYSDRGRALLFNGADDQWTCERSLEIGLDSFTVMAWVWLDSTTLKTNCAAVAQGDSGVAEWMLYILTSEGVNARLAMYGDAGGISVNAGAGTFLAFEDQWTHVAVTRSAAGLCSTYQNGLLMGSDATAADNLNTAKTFTIGCADSHAQRWWQGMIDDVRHYSRALSIGQITQIYNATRWTPYADIALGRIRQHGRAQTGHVRRAH